MLLCYANLNVYFNQSFIVIFYKVIITFNPLINLWQVSRIPQAVLRLVVQGPDLYILHFSISQDFQKKDTVKDKK